MNILLIESNALLRESVKELIGKWNSQAVVDDYESSDKVDSALYDSKYELTILKINTADSKSLSDISRFIRISPDTSVVCLTDSEEHVVVQQMIQMGSRGVITSTASSGEFLAVLQLVLAGGVFVPNGLRGSHVIDSIQVPQSSLAAENNSSNVTNSNYGLSGRQREVIEHLCQGQTNKAISNSMGLSVNTVKSHLTTIFKILEVRNRTEAVALLKRP